MELACAPPRAEMALPMDTTNAGLIRMGVPMYVTSTLQTIDCWNPVVTTCGDIEMVCTLRPCVMSVLPMLLVTSAVSVVAAGSATSCDPAKYCSVTEKWPVNTSGVPGAKGGGRGDGGATGWLGGEGGGSGGGGLGSG